MSERLWQTEGKDQVIKKLTISDLQDLDIVDGFTRWFESSGEKGKAELRELLRQRLKDGGDILAAVENNKIVGFAIIVDWPTQPNLKALDAMEISETYREKGIVFMLVQRVIKEWGNIMALMSSHGLDHGRNRADALHKKVLVELEVPKVAPEEKIIEPIAEKR